MEANSAKLLFSPTVPVVALPDISNVNLLAPFIVMVAPFDRVSRTALAANFEDAITRPSTS